MCRVALYKSAQNRRPIIVLLSTYHSAAAYTTPSAAVIIVLEKSKTKGNCNTMPRVIIIMSFFIALIKTAHVYIVDSCEAENIER